MTKEQRDNQVRIIEEDYPETEALDDFKRPIQHAVTIIRVGDGAVLGKYRETEHITFRDEATRKVVEKDVSGIVAAERACRQNNWKIARY